MNKLVYFYLLLSLSSLCTCKPRIYLFTSNLKTITTKDTVLFNWKVKGKPTLLFTQRKDARTKNDSVTILEFKLVVQKNNMDSSRRILIPLLPEYSIDRVIASDLSLFGDTLIAVVNKDSINWSGFEVIKVFTEIARPLNVLHAGHRDDFINSGVISDVWMGSPYHGYWEFRTLLTTNEKKDHKLIPKSLEIKAIISPKKK